MFETENMTTQLKMWLFLNEALPEICNGTDKQSASIQV